MATLVVSLGSNCYVSWTLRRIGLQTESLPLDWVNSFRFGAMLDALESFSEADILAMQRSSLPVDKDSASVYENPEYGFRLPHEHDVNPENSREEIAARYARRFDRLKSACRSADHVVFIRTLAVATYGLPKETAADYSSEAINRAAGVLEGLCGHDRFTLVLCDQREAEIAALSATGNPRVTSAVLHIPFENVIFTARQDRPSKEAARAIYEEALRDLGLAESVADVAACFRRLTSPQEVLR